MSRRQDIQSAEGIALRAPRYGVLEYINKSAPAGGEIGFAPGAVWFVPGGTSTRNTGFRYTNIGSNGIGSNPTALWLVDAPSSDAQFQFGGGSATMLGSGNMYRLVSGVGLPPATTGADVVVDVFSLPANSLDGISNRGLLISAGGSITGSDASTAKIIFAPSAAVVGSTVTGGTTIATTGSMSQSTKGWFLQAQVFKYGAANANTQMYQETAVAVGTTHGGVGAPAALTATENAAILIAVTINVTTTAADCALWWWEVSGNN